MRIKTASEAIERFYNHQIGDSVVMVIGKSNNQHASAWIGMELGDLCRYYKKLPIHHQVWGEYHWGSVGDNRARLRNHVISMIVPAVKVKCDATIDIIKLCDMVVSDYEYREAHKAIKYTLEHLDSDLGHIDRWNTKYQKAYKIINQLSADCLGAIARRMYEVAEIDEAV